MGSKIMASNFSFLQGEWPALFIEATKAERGVMEPSLFYEPPFYRLRTTGARSTFHVRPSRRVVWGVGRHQGFSEPSLMVP